MQIAGVGQDSFNEITATVSERRYGGNVIVSTDTRAVGRNRITARLRVLDSRGRGARTAASGRHGPYACWHAHRDVLRALFSAYPEATVATVLQRYRGADGFEADYPATAYRNVGSQLCPAYMPQLCVTGDCGNHTAPTPEPAPVLVPSPRLPASGSLVRIRAALQIAERSRPQTHFTGPETLLGAPDLAYSNR